MTEVAGAGILRLLRQSLGVDVHDGRPDKLGDSHKIVRRRGIGDDLEGSGVAAALTLLTVDSVSGKRSSHNGGGDRGEQHEYGGETARAKPFEERFHRVH